MYKVLDSHQKVVFNPYSFFFGPYKALQEPSSPHDPFQKFSSFPQHVVGKIYFMTQRPLRASLINQMPGIGEAGKTKILSQSPYVTRHCYRLPPLICYASFRQARAPRKTECASTKTACSETHLAARQTPPFPAHGCLLGCIENDFFSKSRIG